MSVQFFDWGAAKGGTSPSGPAIPDTANYGSPEQFSGTLAAGNTTITFSNATKNIHIMNTHDTISLEYSLDSGSTWFGIAPYGDISEPVSVTSLLLRGTGATYEINAVLGS